MKKKKDLSLKHCNRLEKTLPQSISNDHSLTTKSKSFVDHDPFLEGGKGYRSYILLYYLN